MMLKKKLKDNNFTIAIALICIFFPLGGVLIMLSILTKWNIFKKNRVYLSTEIELEEVQYHFLPDIDIEYESNIISLEDSLDISDLKYRRKTVLDILKRDIHQYEDFLKVAIRNSDSETTHYVASSILHNKRELDFNLKETRNEYENNNGNKENIINYSDILTKELKLPYLDNLSKMIYTNQNIKILKQIVDNRLSEETKYITTLISLLIGLGCQKTPLNY